MLDNLLVQFVLELLRALLVDELSGHVRRRLAGGRVRRRPEWPPGDSGASTAATETGSCTSCSQSWRRTCSFPQLFPPLPIPSNCYIDLKHKTSMDSLKQKQNNLVLYRRRMGFTQKQVARLLGHRDTSMVSHYEHGRALPPLADGPAPGDHLPRPGGIPVSQLMYDDSKRQIRQQEEVLAGVGQRPALLSINTSSHMKSILDRFIPAISRFRPRTTTDLFALRLAQKLDDAPAAAALRDAR